MTAQTTTTADTATKTETPAEAKPAAPLGDAGRKALHDERQARRIAEQRAREAEERVAALEAEEARRRVAAEKGLTEAQAAFLGDGTVEELSQRADDLLAAFGPAHEERDIRRRPQERLRSGAVPMAEAPNLGQVAESVIKGL